MYDIVVVGAGPAGYSAAINARKREKSVLVIGQEGGWLSRAHSIMNYPGFEDISGADLIELCRPIGNHVLHRLCPANGGCELF